MIQLEPQISHGNETTHLRRSRKRRTRYGRKVNRGCATPQGARCARAPNAISDASRALPWRSARSHRAGGCLEMRAVAPGSMPCSVREDLTLMNLTDLNLPPQGDDEGWEALASAQRLRGMTPQQRANNPKAEPMGHFTGRCKRCGSRDLWDDNLHYGCNTCGAFLA